MNCIELTTPAGQKGRAFSRAPFPSDVQSRFERAYVEDDDEERLGLLFQALTRPEVTFQIFPGEATPVAYYAYVRGQEESLFACVLATREVLRDLVSEPSRLVFETATFQVFEGDFLDALRQWAGRVWPGVSLGDLILQGPG